MKLSNESFSRIRGLLITLVLGGMSYAEPVLGQLNHVRFTPVASEKLSSAFVRCIYKDAKGFMWFGLGNGLVRFDGTNTYRYEHNSDDGGTIPTNRINAITEDMQQNLWIGTAEGLVMYNREKNNFIRVDSLVVKGTRLEGRYVTSLSVDDYGMIWIGTLGNGLYRFNSRTRQFTFVPQLSSIAPRNYITSIFIANDTLWAATKGGVQILDIRTGSTLALPLTDNQLQSKEISQVIRDASGRMWLSSVDREIYRLTRSGEEYEVDKTLLHRNTFDEGSILTICLDSLQNLWLGGENSGLNYLETKTGKIHSYYAQDFNAKELPSNSVRSVYIDNTGITWIGTYNNGPFQIDNRAKKFDIFQHTKLTRAGLAGNSFRSLAEDKEGNIWLACDGGLSMLDRDQQLSTDEKLNKNLGSHILSAVTCDHENNLWIGTWGHGLFKVNLLDRTVKHYPIESNGFGDNKVFCVYEDKKNNIWVGSVGSGLFLLNKKTNAFESFYDRSSPNPIIKTAYVTSVLEDDNNRVWVGTLYGLYKLQRNANQDFTMIRYGNTHQLGSLGSFEVQTIHQNLNNTLWFGTTDNGISVLKKGDSVFTYIQKKDGLNSNLVKAMVADQAGNLWITGGVGLSRYDPRTGSFRNYTVEDGLPSNEFNSNAFLRSKSGKIYFGTNNGLVSFFPDSIQINPIKPFVYLTDLILHHQPAMIGGKDSPLQKHISLTDRIELTYEQRSFAIAFAAINYGQFSQNHYCYRLEGFEPDWNCVESAHLATYTNLDPGDYVFVVKANNSDGVPGANTARLQITVHPLPWKSPWAIAFYILMLCAIVAFLIKLRMDRVAINSQLEFERLAHEKEHSLIESKTQFFTNISHEFRTPLSLIAMPLESLLADELPPGVKARLVTIRNSASKMMRLVNELMDFNKMENLQLKLQVQRGDFVKFVVDLSEPFQSVAEKRNIHFGIHAMAPSIEGWFDFNKLEKVVVNVLSNAFKFTRDDGQIYLLINVRSKPEEGSMGNFAELVIVDNGIGISAEELPFIFDKFYQAKSSSKIVNPGTGIGLSLTQGLVKLHHGTIIAQSAPMRETKFTIHLPMDRSAYSEDEIMEGPLSGILSDTQVGEDIAGMIAEEDVSAEVSRRPKILVVEDNEELRKYISLELRKEFSVWEAKDGVEGFQLALEQGPDLIISDVLMPLKTGTDLCQEIKSNLKTSHIPVILLTAKTTLDDHVLGISAGADVYVTKPFSIRFLMVQVHQLIDLRKKLYARFSQDVYLLPNKLAGNDMDRAFLEKAIDYIHANMQESQMSVDSLANIFHLSHMQVYRKIKALTGKSVVDFIRMVRIKKALSLMESKRYTISEVAYQTGFNSASYFTKCFKDQYGKAPSEYMEANS